MGSREGNGRVRQNVRGGTRAGLTDGERRGAEAGGSVRRMAVEALGEAAPGGVMEVRGEVVRGAWEVASECSGVSVQGSVLSAQSVPGM